MERANEFKKCSSPTCQEAVSGKSFHCNQCDKPYCPKCKLEHVCLDSLPAVNPYCCQNCGAVVDATPHIVCDQSGGNCLKTFCLSCLLDHVAECRLRANQPERTITPEPGKKEVDHRADPLLVSSVGGGSANRVDATDEGGVSRCLGGFEGHHGTNIANSHLSSAAAVVPRSSGQGQTIFFSRECRHVLNGVSVSTLKCEYCSFVYCEDSKCLTHHYSESPRCQSSSTKADLTMLGFVQGNDLSWISSTSNSAVGGGTFGGGSASGGGGGSGGAVGGGASGNGNGHGFNADERLPVFQPGGLSNTIAARTDGGGAGGSGGAVGGRDTFQCQGEVLDTTYRCHGQSCVYCQFD